MPLCSSRRVMLDASASRLASSASLGHPREGVIASIARAHPRASHFASLRAPRRRQIGARNVARGARCRRRRRAKARWGAAAARTSPTEALRALHGAAVSRSCGLGHPWLRLRGAPSSFGHRSCGGALAGVRSSAGGRAHRRLRGHTLDLAPSGPSVSGRFLVRGAGWAKVSAASIRICIDARTARPRSLSHD